MTSLITVLRLGLSLAAILIVGLPIVWVLWPKKQSKISILERATLSFGIGVGVLTLGMLFVAIVSRPFSLLNILLSCLILTLLLTGCFVAVRKRVFIIPSHPRETVMDRSTTSRRLFYLEILLLILIVCEILYVFSEALLYPMSAHDPLSHWGLKAKAFFLQKRITFEGFNAHNYYPVLVPLSETWIYLGLGTVNDGLVKILFPIFFVSLITLFYSFQRRIRLSRLHALFFTAVLIMCGGQLIHFSTIAYADIPLTFFYTVATLSLYLWMVSPQHGQYLVLSGLLSGMAAWTKLEGIMLVGVNSIVLAIYLVANWRNRHVRKVVPLTIHFSLILLFFVPWLVFRQVYGIAGSNEHLAGLRIALFPLVMKELVYAFLEYKRWGMLWGLVVVTTALAFKEAFSSPGIYMLMIVSFNMASLIVAYMTTASEEPVTHMQASVQRLLLHFVPIVVFLMSLQVAKVIGGRTQRGV